jgi:hypothetical protein
MDLYAFVGTELVNGAWQDRVLEVGGSYFIGDFEAYNGEVTEALRKSLFIQPNLFAGSDYSGGSIERSNHKAFLELYGEVEGVYDIYGGMGTYGVAIRLDVSEDNTEIKELLDSLKNYCLIDEEAHSKMEHEWDCEALKDIVSDLCRNIDLEAYIPDYETLLENEEKIEEYAWDAVRELNLNFVHENNSAYLDYEELKPYVEDILLIEHCTKLPLLINREWACEDNRQKYIDKCSN